MRVGILGGGQLGRMLALAGANLGVRCTAMDASSDAVAGHVCELIVDDWQKPRHLERFVRAVDVVTLEWENVPAGLVTRIEQMGAKVRPGVRALSTAQDRLAEKELFQSLGIATPGFAAVGSLAELEGAIARLGLPAVLKTRSGGYDGKGQQVIRQRSEAAEAWGSLGGQSGGQPGGQSVNEAGVKLIVEGFVKFSREVSIIGVRGVDGAVRMYPLTENVHQQGILRTSISPARGSDQLQGPAEEMLRRVMEALEYAGVMALELFVMTGADGSEQLVANEIAPRVHNSGHWTMDGSVTSQFENHMRAVLGLPLGETSIRGGAGYSAAMVNVIGHMPALADVLGLCSGVLKVHDYGKQGRSGRKVGHVNVCGPEARVREMMLEAGEKIARWSSVEGKG